MFNISYEAVCDVPKCGARERIDKTAWRAGDEIARPMIPNGWTTATHIGLVCPKHYVVQTIKNRRKK